MKLLACDRQRTVSDLEMQVRVHMRKMCRNDYGVRARGLGDNAQCLDYLACVWFACRSSRWFELGCEDDDDEKWDDDRLGEDDDESDSDNNNDNKYNNYNQTSKKKMKKKKILQ